MSVKRPLSLRAAAALLPIVFVAGACGQSSQEDNSERDDDGQVVEGGEVGVFRLQEGDCLVLPSVIDSPEVEQIDDVQALPCDQPHDGEVVLVADEQFADLDEFPGETVAVEQGTPSCIAALDEYTGTDFESSTFDVLVLVPSEASWAAIDDRGLTCIGVTLDDALTEAIDTTGSIRAAS